MSNQIIIYGQNLLAEKPQKFNIFILHIGTRALVYLLLRNLSKNNSDVIGSNLIKGIF